MRNRIFVIGVLFCSYPATSFAWEPPIGIPRPAFGIDESVNDDVYTHWVDVDNPNCSNDSDGTPSSPRCSIPRTFDAGSIVQLRGGPYSMNSVTWTARGTAESPVFVRGPADGPKVIFSESADLEIAGTYFIVENIDLPRLNIDGSSSGSHDLVIRHSRIHDHPGTGTACNVHSTAKNIVIWDNEISGNGVIPSSRDHHGIGVRANADNIWILDNHIHHNSGDAIQFCNSCVGGDNNGPVRVYIGRNVMHHDEENALDFKEFQGPVIVSENTIYGYRDLGVSGSNGDAIRINDEGSQGEIWVIYNKIYDSTLGVNPSSAVATTYVIGNVIYDISGSALLRGVDFAVNNTIYDIGKNAIKSGEAVNNIIVNIGRDAIGGDVTGCSNNLIESGAIQVSCNATQTGSASLILDESNSALGIRPNSVAINNGLADHPVYALYESKYGIDIRVSIDGTARPFDVEWDIGAHELSVAPNPPVALIAD